MKKRYEDGIVPQMNQDIRADFARQIRAIRQSQHLTQQVLADRVGTKKSGGQNVPDEVLLWILWYGWLPAWGSRLRSQ